MRLAGLFAALVFVAIAACGGSPTGPSGAGPAVRTPTPGPAPTPPAQPVTGEITIAAASPEPGATLPLRQCPVTMGGTPHSETARYFCTDLHAVFDVVVDANVPDVLLTVTFANGTQQCAFATSAPAGLTAGSRASIAVSAVSFHAGDDDPQAPADLGCRTLPAVTDLLVVQVWERSRASSTLLSREFPVTYTFALPE